YVLPPLVGGTALLATGRRAGWARWAGAAGVAAGVAAALFFRDPERPAPVHTDVVYAGADGFVTRVEERSDEPWLPGRATNISTFLSLHNVHVNRSPVTGRIVHEESVPGGFAPALFARSESNRRRRVAIDGARGRVVVVQVAGLLARRISPWVGAGEDVVAGQRLGIIHFGSRTDVLLPAGSAQVLVRPGDRVLAGVTPLARYTETAEGRCASS
ncbi:MAG: phosphatidylserine decarboxylase, partial [Actinomycetota bacterium]|nr:phosphatidylserine decarboxylase [Actinomycetota bacterium]